MFKNKIIFVLILLLGAFTLEAKSDNYGIREAGLKKAQSSTKVNKKNIKSQEKVINKDNNNSDNNESVRGVLKGGFAVSGRSGT